MTEHQDTIPTDKLRLARKWANWASSTGYLPDDVKAATEVILSLPDPPRPTLADLTPDERADCVGRWVELQGKVGWVIASINEDTEMAFLVQTSRPTEDDRQGACWMRFTSVTPRPDFPRAWSADGTPVERLDPADAQDLADLADDEPDTTHIPAGEAWLVEINDDHYYAVADRTGAWHYIDDEGDHAEDWHAVPLHRLVERFAGEPKATVARGENVSPDQPRPEDVKPGEFWQVATPLGRTWIGTRQAGVSRQPWLVMTRGGTTTDRVNDEEVTLLARLVPQQQARTLDEGDDLRAARGTLTSWWLNLDHKGDPRATLIGDVIDVIDGHLDGKARS